MLFEIGAYFAESCGEANLTAIRAAKSIFFLTAALEFLPEQERHKVDENRTRFGCELLNLSKLAVIANVTRLAVLRCAHHRTVVRSRPLVSGRIRAATTTVI